MNARVRSTLNPELGDRKINFSVKGKIRPGIKVPTRAAQKIPGVIKAYEEGMAVKASYDDIVKNMRQVEKCPKYPLTPSNAPYFRAEPHDFTDPDMARYILDTYGEQREGDDQPRLYRFPVFFPSENIDLIFREQFEAWSASQRLRWSETDPVNGKLMCKKLEDLESDKSRRRRWGGRAEDTVGPCDPNSCDLFHKGFCKHMGSLFFWIPGTGGSGVIELEFSSIYASMNIMDKLTMVSQAFALMDDKYSIMKLIDGKPIFWISKTKQNVSVIDWEKGEANKQAQYIIQLDDSGLDMAKVLNLDETPKLAAPESRTALPPAGQREQIDLGTGEIMTASEDNTITGEAEPVPEHEDEVDKVIRLRKELSAEFKRLGWSAQDTEDWVVANYDSKDAVHNPESLQSMIDALRLIKAEAPF